MKKRYNLLCPIAGKAQRFREEGFLSPKPMILCEYNKTIIERALDPFNLDEVNLIFVVLKEHIDNYGIDRFLLKKFGDSIKIKVIKDVTKGTLCTCLEAENYIVRDLPLVVCTPDITFNPKFKLESFLNYDGGLNVFPADSPAYSYAKIDDNNMVLETKEKEVISNNAASGQYYFKYPKAFFEYAKKMVTNKDTTNNEYYICPIFNYFIENKQNCIAVNVENVISFGTPQDLKEYITTFSEA